MVCAGSVLTPLNSLTLVHIVDKAGLVRWKVGRYQLDSAGPEAGIHGDQSED